MIRIICGVAQCQVPFEGQTVAAVRESFKAQLRIPDGATGNVNGQPAHDAYELCRGDTVEFTPARGS